MTNLDLYKLVREIVLTATGCPTAILANQNEKSPDGEYCAIHVDTTKRQRGQANIEAKNQAFTTPSPIGNVINLDFGVKAQIIHSVELNFYRGDANTYAARMFQANKRPDISALLFQNSVGWQGADAVNDLTALQATKREPRAQVVIRLMYEQSDVQVVNSIYGVLTEIENEDGDIIASDFYQAPTEP